jgi:aminoglycoside phosphotransferase family enzyme/predicted kinase
MWWHSTSINYARSGVIMDRFLIEQMLDPQIYPEPTKTVSHLQTHISHLFLTDLHVYKIKKPVDFGFLDFTTLEKRRFYCYEELRLNRRLSPDIYLGVVELRDAGSGVICFGGDGQLLEYAVKMVRMPEARMMSRLLELGQVSRADIDAIAVKVAHFHGNADQGNGIELFGTVEVIKTNWLENLCQATPYIGRTLTASDLHLIGEWALQRLEDDRLLFQGRIQDGFIRECDGDLHSENICLDGQVHIFDCIEFNEKFRYSDTAADVAFLAMDLENHGRCDLAERFVEQYCELSGDSDLRQVLPLYLTNRAFIRGKVESFRLDDPQISDQEKKAAHQRSQRFFRLARGYVVRERLPKTLFLTCGPTGCGKSAVAEELAFQLGVQQFSSDRERKQLAGVELSDHGAEIYSADWNEATYQRLFELAQEQLDAGNSVIVDATFRQEVDRNCFVKMGEAVGAAVVILYLDCPADLARQRLEQRNTRTDAVSDGTWQVYQRQINDFEIPRGEEGFLVSLDATKTPCEMVEKIMQALMLIPLESGV